MSIVTINNRIHIAIDGDEATQFLHNLVTTDITGLPIGELCSGALLSAQGKVLFSFLIARSGEGYLLEVALEDATDFVKRLKFYRLRAKVNISDPVAVYVSAVWDEEISTAEFVRDARFSTIAVWRCYTALVSNAADTSWTRLRITHGVAEAHSDYAYLDVFPHDVNLDQTAGLSFSKGCYIGQEVVSRMHHRSTARRRLMVVKGDGLMTGLEVMANGKPAGLLGSVAHNEALAGVRLDRLKDALDNGHEITVAGRLVDIQFPKGVTYTWPDTGPNTRDLAL